MRVASPKKAKAVAPRRLGVKGERVEAAMKLRGMTQEELADKAGLWRTHVLAICHGKEVYSATVEMLAIALDVSVSYLYGETDNPKPLRKP